jgi:hypothetical protein
MVLVSFPFFALSLTATVIECSPGATFVLSVPVMAPVLLSFSPFGSLPTFFHL